jgi:2-C-methyl-D-erythritol 2,4-cyclodiphosphate synthase
MSHYRVGIGYDIHRLKKGRPLILGGIKIAHPMGLDGHSDADVLLHAIIDAILGAAGLPDIGFYFPPGEAKTKGIASREMLEKALLEARGRGFRVVNVDSVVITEQPKLAPHRDDIRNQLAGMLHVAIDAVQVKGKTNEGLDAVGAKKAIAAHAVVLIEQTSRSAS